MSIVNSKIKTIVFDLGGVIFLDGTSKIGAILEKEKGYDPEVIKKIIKSEKRKQAVKGEIGDAEFWDWAKTQLPKMYDVEYIRTAYYDSYQLDIAVLELVKQIKKHGYRLVIFSGNMQSRVEYLEQKYTFSKYFDDSVYSFDVGYTKPEPEFFEMMMRSLECNPAEAVLVDDHEKNLEFVEKKYGMSSVLYTEGKIYYLVDQLRRLGVEF